MKRIVLAVSLALLAPAVASATPLLGNNMIPASDQQALVTQIHADRVQHPEVFTRVSDLVGVRPEHYLTTRSRRPSVMRELSALGPQALLPMLDVLAVSGYPRALAPEEQQALEMGLLDVVGRLRDRRAEPVLRAAFERMSSPDMLRAAARGLGALGGDGEIALLSAAARASGPRQLAALEGIGASRRPEATQVLIEVIDGARAEEVIQAASRGLAEVGSSWAHAANGTRTDLPERSTEALVRAFVRTSGATRDAVRLAILSVGSREAPRFIQAAMAGADVDTRAALASLERMVRRTAF
jgi:hypothetical protein